MPLAEVGERKTKNEDTLKDEGLFHSFPKEHGGGKAPI